MSLRVGTIVKWSEECESGQCIGKITEFPKVDDLDVAVAIVHWWESCDKHAEIDPFGTGPYILDCLWEIGQID
jgi:hypothetical protein